MLFLKNCFILIISGLLIILSSSRANSEVIGFDYIFKKAVINSYDLQISEVDIDISKTGLQEARAEYYPKLDLIYNTEYNKDLLGAQGQFESIGNIFLNQNTFFQNVIALQLNYTLLDFGIRGRKAKIAKEDITLKNLLLKRNLRDLKLKMVDLYTDAFISYVDIRAKEQIIPVYEELFNGKERLYLAGTSSKLGLMDEAIKIARLMDSIEASKTKLQQTLQDISKYTLEDYDVSKIQLAPFDNVWSVLDPIENKLASLEAKEDVVLDQGFHNVSFERVNVEEIRTKADQQKTMLQGVVRENTIEFKTYQLEIEKKKDELEILKKQRYPLVSLYTNYLLYGNDRNNPISAIEDIRNRNVTVGLSARLPIFDGFKNSANRKRVNFEIERLELEQDKYSTEVYREYNKLQIKFNSYQNELITKEELFIKSKEKLQALERLSNNQLIDKTEILNLKAEMISNCMDLEKTKANLYSTIKQLETLSEDLQ